MEFERFMETALLEDIRDGDHTSLACVPANTQGKAKLLIKEDGILAGVDIGERIFRHFDPNIKIVK